MHWLSVALLAAIAIGVSAKWHNVTVKGVAVCKKKREPNVKVELWEKDTLDPDDLLSTVMTNSEGEFEVSGGEDEHGNIEPYLLITHSCQTSKPGCHRIGRYVIPKEKIDDPMGYDMTYVTLDIKVAGEKEKC